MDFRVLLMAGVTVGSPLLATANEAMTTQAEAPGFIDGSHLGLNLRHYYANQHTRRSTYLGIKKADGLERTRIRETWVQAAMLNYSSGYTQGAVGFGLDASLFSAVNLERGHGRVANGGDRVLVDSDGDALPIWSRLGSGDLRLRFSSTGIKTGRLLTENPILRYKDNRALPSSFQGIGLFSHELDWLSLQAGSFERAILRTGTGSEKLTTTFGNRAYSGSRISYLGGIAKTPYGLDVSLYASRFEDMWQQSYLGLTQLIGTSTAPITAATVTGAIPVTTCGAWTTPNTMKTV